MLRNEVTRPFTAWVSVVQTTVQDLRYGIRGLRRAPAFAVTAILTLALGIAAISTVLTLINTSFYQDLSAPKARELVVLSATRRNATELGLVSYPDYVHFREHTRTLSTLAAHYSTAPLFVTTQNAAAEINGGVVSANYFELLGIRPVIGRFFNPSEDAVPDRDRVAVLGEALWRRSFDGSPAALGSSVRINGESFTVIGIAPATFRGLTVNPVEIYIPTMMLRVGYRWCRDAFSQDCTILNMIGRLAPGRTFDEAAAEVPALLPAHWRQAADDSNTGITVLRPRLVQGDKSEIRVVQLLASVAAILLLAGCANLAGLLVARGTARSSEFAVRASLGATGKRLLRQVLTESMLLAIAGGIFGVVLSIGLTSLLDATFYAFDAEGHPLSYGFRLQPVVVIAALGISLIAGVLFGFFPAFGSIRVGPAHVLTRQSRTSTTRSPFGRWLIGIQAATAVALVALASLLWASARTVVAGTSYESRHVALLRLRPRLIGYTSAKAQQFQHEVLRRLETLPQVESVSLIGAGAVLRGSSTNVSVPGSATTSLTVGYGEIAPRYFDTLSIPLVRGRDFERRDSLTAPPVAIVSEGLARLLWPGGNAIDNMVVVGGRPRRVVGIVADLELRARSEPLQPYVYTPYDQNPELVDARVCVRVAGDPAAMLPPLVREVNQIDRDVPIAETITLPFQIAGMFRHVRMGAAVVGYAAGVTALLSVIGLYGVLAFGVAARNREFGIRMALGASCSDVLAMVLGEGMSVAIAGIAFGLFLAVGGARLVRHLLYRSAGADFVFYAVAVVVVASGSFLACWVPARRAASIDPAITLRNE